MFNPIFKENVQGQKHLGSCAFAEPELLSYRKLKIVVQKVKNGHKIPIIVTNMMTKINSTTEIATGAPNDTLHQNNAHPKTVL